VTTTTRTLLIMAGALLTGAATSAAETTLPCRQPQLAAAGEVVYVACGTPTSVLVARSSDGGRTFGAPVAVATVGALALGNHRGPRIAADGDTVLVSAIAGETGGGKDGDVLVWRSADRGATWSGPARVNSVPAAAREGLHAMAASGRTVATAWLDLRERGTMLAAAVSRDGGLTWADDAIAYRSPGGTICQCCHPSLFVAPSGRIAAMFRNEHLGTRDMFLVESPDAGRSWMAAQKLGSGTWPLNACPMDGGGIAFDPRKGLVTVWRRDTTVYLASPGAAEVALGEGVNPTLAMTPAGPVVAWNAPAGLVVRAADAGTLTLADSEGRFASLLSTPRGTLLAYEKGGQSVVLPVSELPPSRSAAR
jgi:BNR repeat-like domain